MCTHWKYCTTLAPAGPFRTWVFGQSVALLRENGKTHVRCVSWQRVRIQSAINVLNEVRLPMMMRIILQALFVPCRHHRAHIHSVEKVVNDHTFQSSFFDPCCCITTSHMIGYYTSLPSLSMQARQKGFFLKWAIKICISFDTRWKSHFKWTISAHRYASPEFTHLCSTPAPLFCMQDNFITLKPQSLDLQCHLLRSGKGCFAIQYQMHRLWAKMSFINLRKNPEEAYVRISGVDFLGPSQIPVQYILWIT